MAKQTQTQDFIDEVTGPSVQTHAELRGCVQTLLEDLAKADQQASILVGLAQTAEEHEENTLVDGKYEALISQVRVHQQVYVELRKQLRRLRTSRGILKEQTTEFLALAKDAGYTVP